ncbi:MAG: hypothetical protein PHS02_03915 [Candidatus ainarchaeum sp.]|nr:hypothetical protein [Candidatus ainarchaeum sp.]
MLVSTDRHSSRETRDFARMFSLSAGFFYRARGKKTIEGLVSEARKKGESTLALFSFSEISFISISISGWEWKNKILKVLRYSFGKEKPKGSEIGSFEGKDGKEFQSLFGFDDFYGGNIVVFAEDGKLKIMKKEKNLLEIEYTLQEKVEG